MLSQAELDQFSARWQASLPGLDVAGQPFYTLMKFAGELNLGELFAYPGMDLGFGVQIMTVTLFPTVEIAKECEAVVAKTSPEWRLVGLNDEFLEMLLELVRHQQVKLSISLTPNDSVVFATKKVPELAEKIREQGFSQALLESIKVDEA